MTSFEQELKKMIEDYREMKATDYHPVYERYLKTSKKKNPMGYIEFKEMFLNAKREEIVASIEEHIDFIEEQELKEAIDDEMRRSRHDL